MATCRAVLTQALQALSALTFGDDPSADELVYGLTAVQDVILDIHNARGPLTDVDVTADYTPGENQRVRVEAGSNVFVTLPNSVPIFNQPNPYDYGFSAQVSSPPAGSSATADGVQFRQPRDGARIEIVGTTQTLYFYRADLNAWNAATGLAIDDEVPLNARFTSALAALVAERLIESLPALFEPTPAMAKRIARANSAILIQTGTARDPVRAQFY